MIKLKPYYFIILGLLVVLGWQQCQGINDIKSERKSSADAVDFFKKENSSLIQTKDLMAQDMVAMNQNIVNERTARDLLAMDFEGFKKIQSQIKAELLTEIRGLEFNFEAPANPDVFAGVPFQDTNCINMDTVDKYFLRVPQKVVSDTSQWMRFYATVGKSFNIDSLILVNKFDATLGWKKPDKAFKFLRKSEPVLAFNSYNPYSTAPYVNNLVVEEDGTKFGKILLSRPAFFVYGFLTNSLINKNTGNGSN